MTISKDANIVAVDGRLHELGYFLEDLILWYVATENLVESELHFADTFPTGRSIHRALVESHICIELVDLQSAIAEDDKMSRWLPRSHLISRDYSSNATEDSDVAL